MKLGISLSKLKAASLIPFAGIALTGCSVGSGVSAAGGGTTASWPGYPALWQTGQGVDRSFIVLECDCGWVRLLPGHHPPLRHRCPRAERERRAGDHHHRARVPSSEVAATAPHDTASRDGVIRPGSTRVYDAAASAAAPASSTGSRSSTPRRLIVTPSAPASR